MNDPFTPAMMREHLSNALTSAIVELLDKGHPEEMVRDACRDIYPGGCLTDAIIERRNRPMILRGDQP